MRDDERAKAPAYAGNCPKCSKMVAAAVDIPEHKKDTAKEVASWIRDGLLVSRMTVAEVRASDWGCECKKTERMKLGLKEKAA